MLKKWLQSYKKSVFTIDNKNLTVGSKIALLIFIFVILSIIGAGVSMQRSYIESPYEKFGHRCSNTLDKHKEIEKFQNRDVSQDIYGTNFRHKYWSLNDFKYNHHRQSEYNILREFGKNEECRQLGTLFLDVANNSAYEDKLILFDALNTQIVTTEGLIKSKTDEYSSMLLEDIAHQEKEFSILSSSSKVVKQELNALRAQLKKFQTHIEQVDSLTDLKVFHTFQRYIIDHKTSINEAHKSAIRYYRFQYTINTFIFLFPLWLLFYFAYRQLKKRSHLISAHLSVNVANVAALYIVFNLCALIYDIIPKVFLSKLVDFLSQYNLTVLLNVAVILIFMAIFGAFIYKIQKNRSIDDKAVIEAENRALKTSRIKKRLCSECGSMNANEDKYCGHCAHSLQKTCQACHTINGTDHKYCSECSTPFIEIIL